MCVFVRVYTAIPIKNCIHLLINVIQTKIMTNLRKSFLKTSIFCFLILAIGFLNSCNKEQEQILEVGENPILEQNIMSGEFIDHILFFETADFVPHYCVTLGLSPVPYRLDKQNPATPDFIQLIKDAEEGIEPLKVTIDESGKYFTNVVKVSETEAREWRESLKGRIWEEEDVILDNEEIDFRYNPSFPNLEAIQEAYEFVNTYRCTNYGPNLPFCIPFDYKADGCFARAHRIRELIQSEYNTTSYKVFIFADRENNKYLQIPGCPDNDGWMHHIATYVKAADTGEFYVIDPSITSGPVTIAKWASLMGEDNRCGMKVQDGSKYKISRTLLFNCGALGQYGTDPNYIHTHDWLEDHENDTGC